MSKDKTKKHVDEAQEAKDAKEATEEETQETTNESEAPEQPEENVDEQKSAEEEAINTKYLRLMADYQNMKRRVEKEKQDIYAFANEKIVKDMLGVIDNFERALNTETSDEKFKEGMELILKQFEAALEKAGVSEIKALGEEFDPNFHNAVMMEDTDEYESGKVSGVMQKGYILNNRVVRPAMVKVAN